MPLVEAFYKQVPVLAYAASAVPATMDGAGVLFTDKDPYAVAALMDAILSGRRSAGCDRRRTDCGREAPVWRLIFRALCWDSSTRILRSPRAAEPHVAFDFWHQFDAAEASRNCGSIGRPSTWRCRLAAESDVDT